MATSGYYWQQFKEANLRLGYHESELGSIPGAREAVEKDAQAEWDRKIHASPDSWYNHQDGRKLSHFENDQQLQDAISTREYRESPNFRAAVQRMAENSPALLETPAPTEDLLAEATRADALRATYKQLVAGCASDPVKRLELVSFLSNPDPDVQNLIAEGVNAIDNGQSHSGLNVRHVGSDLGHAMANEGPTETPAEAKDRETAKAVSRQELFQQAFAAGIDVGPEGAR